MLMKTAVCYQCRNGSCRRINVNISNIFKLDPNKIPQYIWNQSNYNNISSKNSAFINISEQHLLNTLHTKSYQMNFAGTK